MKLNDLESAAHMARLIRQIDHDLALLALMDGEEIGAEVAFIGTSRSISLSKDVVRAAMLKERTAFVEGMAHLGIDYEGD